MDLVTRWNSRLFRTWPNSGNWLVLAQRMYMKASAVVKKDRVATTFFGSTRTVGSTTTSIAEYISLVFGNLI